MQRHQVLGLVAFMHNVLVARTMDAQCKSSRVEDLDTTPLFLERGTCGMPIEALPKSGIAVVSLADRPATLALGGAHRPSLAHCTSAIHVHRGGVLG